MTKIYLLFIITVIATTAQAQIRKNSLLVGGDISFSNSDRNQGSIFKTNGESQFVNLSIGSAIKDNSVLGIFVLYGHNTFESPNSSGIIKEEINSYGGGVFYRKYKPLIKDLYFFGEGQIGVLSGKTETTFALPNNISTEKEIGVFLNLSPGLSYQLIKNLQLQVSLPNLLRIEQSSSKTKNSGDPSFEAKESHFNFSTGLNGSILSNLGIGFRLVF